MLKIDEMFASQQGLWSHTFVQDVFTHTIIMRCHVIACRTFSDCCLVAI